MSLRVKEQKFVEQFVKLGNAKEAAIAAGYSKKTAATKGSQLRKKPNVSEAIKNRMDELKSDLVADEQEVMQFLTRVLRKQEKEVIVTDEGKVVPVPLSGRDRIKSAELIGKRTAMWTDNNHIDASVEGGIVITDNIPDNASDSDA